MVGAGGPKRQRRTPLRCLGFEFFFVKPSEPVKRVTTWPLLSPAATPVFSNPPAAGIANCSLV